MYKFVKTKGYDVWGLVIENLEQLKEYTRVVAYPKSCLVTDRLIERIDYNEKIVKKGGYAVDGHWGDKLAYLADLEIQNSENPDMTVLEMKVFITELMVGQKQRMIEKGQPVLTWGFSYKEFTSDLEIVEEKILDTIPVEFVEYYKTKDYYGIIFNV
jgi:hypothetical protein